MTHPWLTALAAAEKLGDMRRVAVIEIAMGGCVAPATLAQLTHAQTADLEARYGVRDDGTCSFFGVRGIAAREVTS